MSGKFTSVSMQPTWGAATDVGAVREQNEDSLFAASPVFVVADGMGGHAAGEVASRIVVETLAALDDGSEVGDQDVRDAVHAANMAVLEWSLEHPETLGMGTTATGVCFGSDGGEPHWIVFNVGDSRVYRFADDALAQVTTDHSEVQELVAAGQLTPDQAKNYLRRNVVTRSLGTLPAPPADTWVLPIVSGERFVACSDGLTLEVEEDEIAGVLRTVEDPQTAADTLVAMAVDAGGRDNVTVIVVDAPQSSS